MADRDRITKAVYLAVDALNAELPAGVSIEKSLDAPVYGASRKKSTRNSAPALLSPTKTCYPNRRVPFPRSEL